MRSLIFILLALPLSLAAADTDPRLQQLLKQYPDADTNRDGVLTLEEAQAHAKVIRGGKKGGAANSATAAIDGGTAAAGTRRPTPTHADVRYGPHERNVLDLWLAPASGTPAPLVVFIHGGGFVNGSKAGASPEMIRGCLDAGVSFMAINYRFRPSAPIQDILRDCARSIQFVRAHAQTYGLDPKRIATYGGSAGAGTSLWLAFHPDLADPAATDPVLRESSRVVAAGAINTQATYNLLRWPDYLGQPDSTWDRPGEVPAFYGATSREELETPRYRAILADTDMLGLITKDDAPVFLFTSHPDAAITNRGLYLHHPSHAREVKKACDAAGVPAAVGFAMAEPRLEGDYQSALRAFLFKHLGVKTPAR